MEHLWRASGCHGFNITPTTNIRSIENFVDEVVPLLQAKEFSGPTTKAKPFATT